MDQELIALKNEIRDLKTAQQRPSIMKLYQASFTFPQSIAKGFHYWTIHYENSENQTAPIANDNFFFFVLENYDSNTNTQKIVVDVPYDDTYAGNSYTIYSTRPIASITKD